MADGDRKHPGARAFGDPACRECGYEWTTSYEDAVSLIANAPQRFGALIEGREVEAMRKPNADTWSPSGYVWHTSDWFRIQGQRIYAISHDPNYRFVSLGAEPGPLGEIFVYDQLPPKAGLWALQWASDLFIAAASDADRAATFRHPSGDHWSVEELVVWVGHEAFHHELDIKRGLGDA